MLTLGAAAVVASRRYWLARKIEKGVHTLRAIASGRATGAGRMKCFNDVT
jgi:hypothetical protein